MMVFRFGTHYNNPSFGYHCLPKDTKQLRVPAFASTTRKDFVAESIVQSSVSTDSRVGVRRNQGLGDPVLGSEPELEELEFFRSRVVKDLQEFKRIRRDHCQPAMTLSSTRGTSSAVMRKVKFLTQSAL